MKKLILLSFLFLTACSGGTNVADLEQYVADVAAKPRGRIQPLPEFKPYSAFIYSASAMRSPFESPAAFEEMSGRFAESVDAPDASAEYLERGYDNQKKMHFYKVFFNEENS